MTTPRIEEQADKISDVIKGEQAEASVYHKAIEELQECDRIARQAGSDEAVEIVKALRDDPRGSSCLDCMDWESALDDTIKALQDNK